MHKTYSKDSITKTMGDLLLTKNKQKQFQEKLYKLLSEAFNLELQVRVESEGDVRLRGDNYYDVLDEEEIFQVLKDTTLTYNNSSYRVVSSDDPRVVCSLERKEW